MVYICNPMAQVAKLFMNGRSQAVRLPAEYRFEGKEVYVRRDEATGDVILSARPQGWDDFFALAGRLGVPPDFMDDRQDPVPETREPLR